MAEPLDDPGGQISKAQRAIAEYTAQRTAVELAALSVAGGNEPAQVAPFGIETLSALPLNVSAYPVVLVKPSPAAGADFTFTVPAGFVWQVCAIRAQLVTSAAVANRVVRLNIADADAHIYGTCGGNVAHTASLTVIYSWPRAFPLVSTSLGTGPLYAGFPAIPIIGGHTISTSTASIQAGDQWSAITLYAIQLQPRTPGELDDYAASMLAGHIDPYPGVTEWALHS